MGKELHLSSFRLGTKYKRIYSLSGALFLHSLPSINRVGKHRESKILEQKIQKMVFFLIHTFKKVFKKQNS